MNERQIRRTRSSWRYTLFAKHYRQRNPLCAECKRQGRTVAADEVDHIVPVAQAPHRMYDPSNLQSLCRPCHEAKSAGENRRRKGATIEGDLA